jgi:putative oxidoreductase
MLNQLFRLNFAPVSVDAGLLVLRIAIGVCLFVEHGLFKIPLLFNPAAQFPDPLGLGVAFTVAFAFLSDGIGSILMLLGLATRFAAVIMIVNLVVAWGMVYGFQIEPANGELLALFIGGTIAVGLAGPGRYSIDALIRRKTAHVSRRDEVLADRR